MSNIEIRNPHKYEKKSIKVDDFSKIFLLKNERVEQNPNNYNKFFLSYNYNKLNKLPTKIKNGKNGINIVKCDFGEYLNNENEMPLILETNGDRKIIKEDY